MILAMLLTSAVLYAQAIPDRLVPVDEAASEPELVRSRAALIGALRERDVDRILAFVAADVSVSQSNGLSEEKGTMLFRESLKYTIGDRVLADHMLRALESGGSFTMTRGSVPNERQFCAPYTYSAYPKHAFDLNPSGNQSELPVVVIRPDVVMRSRPSIRGRVIGHLSYRLVFVDGYYHVGELSSPDPDPNTYWYEIVTPDQKRGWIDSIMVRDPSDWHVCFAPRDGKWMVTIVERDREPNSCEPDQVC
jgi:hypothetical protein